MDSTRGAFLPIVANFRLRATVARWGTVSGHEEISEGASRSSQMGPHSGGDGLSGLSPGKHPARNAFTGGWSNYPPYPMGAPKTLRKRDEPPDFGAARK